MNGYFQISEITLSMEEYDDQKNSLQPLLELNKTYKIVNTQKEFNPNDTCTAKNPANSIMLLIVVQ